MPEHSRLLSYIAFFLLFCFEFLFNDWKIVVVADIYVAGKW